MCQVTGLEGDGLGLEIQDTPGVTRPVLVWPLATKAVSSLWPFNIPLGWFFLFKTYTVEGKFPFQGWAYFFCNGLDSKYFALCRSNHLGHNYSTLIFYHGSCQS